MHSSEVSKYNNNTTVTFLLPLYRSACVSQHLWLRTAVFCWCKVLLPACYWIGGLLAIVDLELTTDGVRTGTSLERWREKIPNCRCCNAETACK